MTEEQKKAWGRKMREAREAKKKKEVPEEPIKILDKSCIFCKTHSNLTRMVNMQTVVICEKHYYSETVGKIAQKLNERKLQNA